MMTIEVQEQGKMKGKWQQMRPKSERQRAEWRKKAEGGESDVRQGGRWLLL
jgi:hypothetical protein